MIIDDDRDMNLLLSILLKESGMNMISASDGQEALDFLSAGASPNLILTDICMPGMGGVELIEKLRNHPRASGVPVILSSSFDGLADLSKNIGVQGYLRKPFHVESFNAMINHHLSGPERRTVHIPFRSKRPALEREKQRFFWEE